jgi:hypothetical protein
MRFLIVALLLLNSIFISLAGAQASSSAFDSQALTSSHNPLMTPEEQKIQQRARLRAYPGGSDEESLKVQSQLPMATRKMAPATEAPMDSDAGTTPSDD